MIAKSTYSEEITKGHLEKNQVDNYASEVGKDSRAFMVYLLICPILRSN